MLRLHGDACKQDYESIQQQCMSLVMYGIYMGTFKDYSSQNGS